MLLSSVFSSADAWNKLSAIPINPILAYEILKYSRLVSAEHSIVEQQRVSLIRELTGTKPDEDASLEPGTKEFGEYVLRFNEILKVESSLELIGVEFEDVLKSVGDRDDALSVADLAALEPFFKVE